MAYNTNSSSRTTWGSTNYTWLDSTYRGLGLFRKSSTEMLLFRTNSGSNLNVVSCKNMTGQTVSTKKTLGDLSGMTSFQTMKIDSDNYLTLYKTTSWSMTNTNHTKMYLYNYTDNDFTTMTVPFYSGYMYVRYLAPANKPVFKFTADPYSLYTITNKAFTKMQAGNLLEACFNSNTGSIGYYSGSTFRACIPANNFSIKDTNDNVNTYSFDGDESYNYNVIEGVTTKDYDFSHEVIENIDSTNNVLIISNYLNQDRYNLQSYKFYPKSDKNIFLWMYRNGSPRFIYNKTEYVMQISDGSQWSTTDTENDIM